MRAWREMTQPMVAACSIGSGSTPLPLSGFRQHFEWSRVSLGSRYTPETNVELSVRQDFVAFARHPHLQNEIDGWHSRLAEKGQSAVRAYRATRADGARDQADCVATTVNALAVLLDSDPVATGLPYPTEAWTSTASACLDVARNALHWCFDLPLSEPGTMGVEPEQWARHTVHELVVTLQDIADALSSKRWRMANANAVLLKGPAGIGKSHLIADVVNHHPPAERALPCCFSVAHLSTASHGRKFAIGWIDPRPSNLGTFLAPWTRRRRPREREPCYASTR